MGLDDLLNDYIVALAAQLGAQKVLKAETGLVDTQFFPDSFSMTLEGIQGNVQFPGNIAAIKSVPDQRGNPQLRRRQFRDNFRVGYKVGSDILYL